MARRRSAGTARTSSCPTATPALAWAVRFESVNYRARVWLNGKPVGRNTRRLHPVRVRASTALKRRGTNRLVVRVDSRRLPTDFPPAGLHRRRRRRPAAGGTTAGIQREVYLQAARHASTSSRCRCARSSRARPAPRRVQVDGRRCANVTGRGRARVAHRHASARKRLDLGTQAASGATASRPFTTTLTDRQAAQLWSPRGPHLYAVSSPRPRGGAHGRRLHAAQRHPLDQGRATGACCLNGQRREPARRRRARGLQGAGLRDRQRLPRPAASRRPRRVGATRHAHALPAAPLHARARRPARAC